MLLRVLPLVEEGSLVSIRLEPLSFRGGYLEFLIEEIDFPLLGSLRSFLKLYSMGIWKVPEELLSAALKRIAAERSWTLPIYKQLLKVGLGERITYGELARRADTSARAVGLAMRLNPFPLIIPCHRVVAKRGLGGYSMGIEVKKALLEWEERRKREKLVEEER